MARGISYGDILGKVRRNYTIQGVSPSANLLKLSVNSNFGLGLQSRLTDAIDRANARIAVELKAALDAAMSSPSWPTLTGAADIIDTGDLRESGEVLVTNKGIQVAYSSPYALLVHYGGYILPYGNTYAEKVYLPARPWLESVLLGGGPVPKFDLESIYREEINRAFSR